MYRPGFFVHRASRQTGGLSIVRIESRMHRRDGTPGACRWDAIFANTMARDQQPVREKQDASHNRSAVSLGYGSDRVLLPHSAIAGQELDCLCRA
jgi:hypothetical protein